MRWLRRFREWQEKRTDDKMIRALDQFVLGMRPERVYMSRPWRARLVRIFNLYERAPLCMGQSMRYIGVPIVDGPDDWMVFW